MVGFTGETYQEALHDWQKAFTLRLRTLLLEMGWKWLPDEDRIKQLRKDVWGYRYFHIDFKGLVPYRIDYKTIESVSLDRKPDKAAERIYSNRMDTETTHIYEHEKDVTTRRLSSTTNMQGLEISNKFTIGTGEQARIKVENETEIKVTATFEQHRESETAVSDSETDTTEIVVPPNTRVRVVQAKWKSRLKQTDEAHLLCHPAFEVHSHRKWIPKGIYPNRHYKKRGKHARRALAFSDLADFRVCLKGISADHPRMRTNYLKNKKIADILDWMEAHTAFRKIEESVFENASFGEVVIDEIE